MKIGDKVKIVDEQGTFIIKKIDNEHIIVEDINNFEICYNRNEVIPDLFSEINSVDFKNILLEKEENSIKVNRKGIIKKNKKDEYRKIDLHIGQLVDFVKDIEPHKILQKQLFTARTEINKAKKDKVSKMIIIHGKGKGKLKEEIYKLLSTIEGIEYFEADIIRYNFGAVEIRFK